MTRFSALWAVLPALVALWAPPAAHAQTTYRIDPKQSVVTYSMEHPMHRWSGTSHAATGIVVLDAAGRPAEVRVDIPVTSFDSGNSSRDSHMAEAAETYIYKNVSFRSTAITPAPARGDTLVWNVAGRLTFHGVTKPLETPVRVTLHGSRFEARGAFDVPLTAFDIKPPRLMMVPVKDQIHLDLDVVAAR